MLLNHCF